MQKSKSRDSLHEVAKKEGYKNILEVSTNSDNELGWKLSAFNLMVDFNGKKIPLESAFQGSKVFEGNIQYEDIYFKDAIKAKKDERLKDKKIIKFRFNEIEWDTEPKTSFYDYLYISTIYKNYPTLLKEVIKYKVFTDIAFNPKKSINCQAKSCAILVSLYYLGKLEEAISSKEKFLKIVYDYKKKPEQKSLF
ncbi:DUF6977 family protein [Lebetimonas sp. JS170]|uniref:DarT1-associated NADAR antitoxin family protein n=2 Tax=Lebetimonas TaxID=267989 RepID=UPI0039F639EA